jgi:hypothetical protein
MTNKPVQDFIIESERNLRIASAVAEAWADVRKDLVESFFKRLGARLTTELKGWTCDTYNEFYVTRYSGFYLTKPAWKDEYFIDFSLQDYGAKIILGLSRAMDKPEVKKRDYSEEILTAVKKLNSSASAGGWWEAKFKLNSPAADWTKPEVLWQMHSSTAFLDEVAAQMLEVAKIVEPIIDRLIQTI